jgi:hypothetical protein
MWLNRWAFLAGITLSFVVAGHFVATTAAQTPAKAVSRFIEGRFEMQVVESYDAQFDGDEPGHICRVGGLNDMIPKAALGDAIFCGDEKIGVVSGLKWSQANGSLEIDFDPLPGVRIAIGETVWIKLGDAPSGFAATTPRNPAPPQTAKN